MLNSKKGDPKDIEDLIKAGSDIAGSATGAGIGYLLSGPNGAIIGGASGPILKFTFLHLVSEIKNRLIGEREKVRIGATIAFAAEKIQENLENGMEIRQDDFFEKKIDEYSPADEILEGILLVAQREHQEKKLRYYGNLVANIAFVREIDREQANFFIKLADSLSYRQICILNLFINKDEYNLRRHDYNKVNPNPSVETVLLLQEIYDLDSYGILNCSGKVLLGFTQIEPAKLNIVGIGELLYALMELESINGKEINQIADLLK